MITNVNGTTVNSFMPSSNSMQNNNSIRNNSDSSKKVSGNSQNSNSAVSNMKQENVNQSSYNAVQGNNQSISEQTADDLQRQIRKEYIERNYYIHKEADVPVLEIKNNDTEKVIAQYPSEMYLQIIMGLKSNQNNTQYSVNQI